MKNVKTGKEEKPEVDTERNQGPGTKEVLLSLTTEDVVPSAGNGFDVQI